MTAPSDLSRVIGAPTLRQEAVGKTTGATRYTGDIYLPGLLYARAVRSPYPHARIRKIDPSAALALDGVVAVLTAEDLPNRLMGRSKLKDMPLLARDVVRFTGEAVAVVAATDRQTAGLASQLVDVEYEPLPAVFDALEAMNPDAVVVHPDLASYRGVELPLYAPNVFYHRSWRRGDPDAGFAEADVVLETTYTTAPQHQCYMEPRVCQAAIGPDGKVTFWSSNKAPFPLRGEIAEYLGLPQIQIDVISTNVGGDFGGKGRILAEPLCYYLANRTGRPVRFIMTRAEEMIAGSHRHGSVTTIKAGVKRDGRLTAWQARVVYNTGAYAAHNVNTGLGGASSAVGPYRIPHVAVEAFFVYTNLVHHGHMRAPGDAQTVFAVECHMDALAQSIGIDPVEFRRLNAVERDDPSPLGQPWRDNHLKETIELAVAAHRKAGPVTVPAGFVHGSGVACAERYTGYGKSGARVRANPEGTVTVVTGGVDVGTGLPTLLRQIAADALQLPLEQVAVELADTDAALFDQGAGNSRHTPVAGNAVLQAANEMLKQAAALAAQLLECHPADLRYEAGAFRVAGTFEPAVELGKLASAALMDGGQPLAGSAVVEMSMAPEVCFATAIADVAVDPRTGQLKILRVISAHDVGKVLNPTTARSQMEGAVLQGVGYATTEAVIYGENGEVVTPLLSLYGMPNAADVPEVVPLWLEGASGPGPFGAKSIGEIGFTPVAPAIANAVRAATGGEVTDIPLTPERVLRLATAPTGRRGVPPLVDRITRSR